MHPRDKNTTYLKGASTCAKPPRKFFIIFYFDFFLFADALFCFAVLIEPFKLLLSLLPFFLVSIFFICVYFNYNKPYGGFFLPQKFFIYCYISLAVSHCCRLGMFAFFASQPPFITLKNKITVP